MGPAQRSGRGYGHSPEVWRGVWAQLRGLWWGIWAQPRGFGGGYEPSPEIFGSGGGGI